MEQTSQAGQIQLSEATGKLLKDAGKGYWLRRREDTVYAKGIGEIISYFLEVTSKKGGSDSHSDTGDNTSNTDDKSVDPERKRSRALTEQGRTSSMIALAKRDETNDRLVEWAVEVLLSSLKQIELVRKSARKSKQHRPSMTSLSKRNVLESGFRGSTHTKPRPDGNDQSVSLEIDNTTGPSGVIDEVKEVISLPQTRSTAPTDAAIQEVALAAEVEVQCRDFVHAIAAMYHCNPNPFHGFEHACHVTQSVCKLLSRIKAPELPEQPDVMDHEAVEQLIHDHTFGIASDPLIQVRIADELILNCSSIPVSLKSNSCLWPSSPASLAH